MLKSIFAKKSTPAPDARIDSLADEIGRAQAKGDEKAEKKLRKELEPLVANRNADLAEDRIAEARAHHERRRSAVDQVDAYRAELEDLAKKRAELGERMRAAADSLADAWAEHEELWREADRPLRRRRTELVRLTRFLGLDTDVPCVSDIEEALGVGDGFLYPAKHLARIHEKNDRGRVVFKPEPAPPRERPWNAVERVTEENRKKDRRAG